jgi:hypothetical protein
MMISDNHSRSYKFNFWKDRFWIWVLVLPIGLICWILPFVVLFGLMGLKDQPDYFPYIGFAIVFLPAYLVGWIFVYSVMEGIYTRVNFTDDVVSIRLPSLIFPLFPIYRHIDLNQVHRANFFAPYGSRAAVFLYFYRNNKEKHFYLPRFNYNPAYQNELSSLEKRIESQSRLLPQS